VQKKVHQLTVRVFAAELAVLRLLRRGAGLADGAD
jgi:hypothetical protein